MIDREQLIARSVTEAWTLKELGNALGVTRQRAEQLLKARGLDKIRVSRRYSEVKEKPIKWCQECGTIIQEPQKQKYHAACYEVKKRRYLADRNRERYRTDPDFRKNHSDYKKAHPEKNRAAVERYYQTVGGQLHYEAMLERARTNYRNEPKLAVPCVDCGETVYRKQSVLDSAKRRGLRSPLCTSCRGVAIWASRKSAPKGRSA